MIRRIALAAIVALVVAYTPQLASARSASVTLVDLGITGSYAEASDAFVGTRIAFVSMKDGNAEIYSVLPDGSSLTRLTNSLASDIAPAWSPDGAKVAFGCGIGEEIGGGYNLWGPRDICVMNSDGSGLIRLIGDLLPDNWPTWSPDGSRIAFSRNADIFTIAPDGTGLTRLTDGAGASEPAWSPDGSRIAYTSMQSPCPGGCPFPNPQPFVPQVFVMNADGTGAMNLSGDVLEEDEHPAWSPDGTRLSFTSHRVAGGAVAVWLMDADGSNKVRITPSPGNNYQAAWSPDGTRIVFVRYLDPPAFGDVFIMNADGTGATVLVSLPGFDAFPDWENNVLPEGTHDGATDLVSVNEYCYANGWASDPNDRSADVTVRILSDGDEVWTGPAGEYRSDLLDAGVGDGTAAFWVNLDGLVTPDVAHVILVQAQDIQTGEWVDLGQTPRTITCTGLRGNHDGNSGVVAKASCGAWGWVYDADTPTGPRVEVRVRVDGKVVAETTANLYRDDVRLAGYGDGYSGWAVNLFGKVTPRQLHVISVEVRDTTAKRIWVPLKGTDLLLTCAN